MRQLRLPQQPPPDPTPPSTAALAAPHNFPLHCEDHSTWGARTRAPSSTLAHISPLNPNANPSTDLKFTSPFQPRAATLAISFSCLCCGASQQIPSQLPPTIRVIARVD
ncbi:hypothetical protein L209DRAFT_82883 [Thermothelomyces heterothallicus CBS 203.75]